MGSPAKQQKTAAEWTMGVAESMASHGVEGGAAAGRAAACAATAAMEGDVRATGYCLAEMTANTARAGAGLASAVTLTTVGTIMEIQGAAIDAAERAAGRLVPMSPTAQHGAWYDAAGRLVPNQSEDDAQAPTAADATGPPPLGAASRATAAAAPAAVQPEGAGAAPGAPAPGDVAARLQEALGRLTPRGSRRPAGEPPGGHPAPDAASRSPAQRREDGACACATGLRALAARRRSRGDAPQQQQPPLAASEPEPHLGGPVGDTWDEAAVEASRATVERHVAEAPWHPTVLLYDASSQPPPLPTEPRKPRPAFQTPLNSSAACPISNRHFEGHFLFLHRTPEGAPEGLQNPYEHHFEGKTRRWQARVQGRFRRKPTGSLWTGCVLEDFDYIGLNTISLVATLFRNAFVPLLEVVVGERFYFAWGSRGEEAESEDAELATIVTNPAGFDQVIVTPAGETPPGLDSDISELGFRRSAMQSSAYRQAVQEAMANANTEDTYTFCVWGASRFIDVMNDAFVNVFPGVGPIKYSGFLDEWPAHFVLYDMDDDPEDPRHLERKKRYMVDIMVWSTNMELPRLPERYAFADSSAASSPGPPGARRASPPWAGG